MIQNNFKRNEQKNTLKMLYFIDILRSACTTDSFIYHNYSMFIFQIKRNKNKGGILQTNRNFKNFYKLHNSTKIRC